MCLTAVDKERGVIKLTESHRETFSALCWEDIVTFCVRLCFGHTAVLTDAKMLTRGCCQCTSCDDESCAAAKGSDCNLLHVGFYRSSLVCHSASQRKASCRKGALFLLVQNSKRILLDKLWAEEV